MSSTIETDDWNLLATGHHHQKTYTNAATPATWIMNHGKQMETVRHILRLPVNIPAYQTMLAYLKTQVREKEVETLRVYYELCDRTSRNICHNNIWRVYTISYSCVVWHKIGQHGLKTLKQ
jgi:hypothetical protein